MNHTGACRPSLPGSLPPAEWTSGVILRLPGGKMSGTVTLTHCSATSEGVSDYSLEDMSEKTRQVISDCLDIMRDALSTESATMSWARKSVGPASPKTPSGRGRTQKDTSATEKSSQRSLWGHGPKPGDDVAGTQPGHHTDMGES